MKPMIKLVSLFTVCVFILGAAKPDTVLGTDLPIMAGHMIEIKSYDPKTKSYKVVAVQFPGEGSSTVTLEGLAKAIETIQRQKSRIQRDPTEIVGQQFKTDADLPSLTEKELKLRKSQPTP